MKITKYPDGASTVSDTKLGELKTIFKDGKFTKRVTLTEVREKIKNG